ncbi:hypothetical protein CHS0354_035168 [Potamilus streckersoni]|uniref:Major facilitator superfamily (MFS) profile domain-containing protein n=1 Tax=Potamilus streckersoni TaxID=2493646 RepID=A0AAE0TFW3_9BIVA|nr:hypothetical protein CHS0354_035168 [Potamilus streckersoni]
MVLTRSQEAVLESKSRMSENGNRQASQDSSPAVTVSSEHKMLYIIFISLVIDLLGFTLILPLLPSLLDYYGTHGQDSLYHTLKTSVHGFRELVGAPDTPRWNSVLFGGLIGSLFSLLQFLASPVLGATSDVYGRKPVLILSMLGIAASYALWAVSHNFTLFVITRIIGGISKGNVSISTAVVADILPQEKRGKGMALIGIAFSIGFVFGPIIGAIFSRYAREHEGQFYVVPALFALFLALLDIVFLMTFFKETLPENKRAQSIATGWQKKAYLINPVSLFRFSSVTNLAPSSLDSVRRIGTVYFLYLFTYSGLEFTLTFLTHHRLQYDSMQQGKMFFFIGLIMALVQGGYVRRIAAGKELKIAKQGIVILVPAFILMGFSGTATFIYISLILFSFASATVVPCLTTMISQHGGEDQKGTILGVFRSLGALARSLGPIVASTVYWSCGAEVCYISGGVSLILPFLLMRQIKSHQD